MNDLSLKERADHLRELVWDLDDVNTLTSEPLLLNVFALAEELGAALLAEGSAEPALKSEIIGWVVRFREEKRQHLAASQEPVTRTFDYDTTDPRNRYGNREKKKDRSLRVNFGSAPGAAAFAQDMIALRRDVDMALEDDGTDPAVLLARIVRLYKGRKGALNSRYEHEVGDELDGMAIRVAGITAREAAAGTRRQTLHKPVPDEIAPIFTRQVLSGGLPTLGRSRR